MKISVRSAVRAAAQMLGVADGVEAHLLGEETEAGKRDTELLLECFNRVENELALDYLPLLAQDEKNAQGGRVSYAELSYPAARILRVEDVDGKALKYKLFPDHLQTSAGTVKVTYAYSPAQKSLDEESDYQTGVSERLFAYGMAAEYSLAEGELEGARAWDKKYREGIAAAYRVQAGKQIRSRRWI